MSETFPSIKMIHVGYDKKKKVLQLRIKYNINHFTKQRRGGGRKEEEGKN